MAYQLGQVKANTVEELGEKTIKYLGLGLENDENIGRQVRFINPTCIGEQSVFTIVSCQKVWGHNEEGKYTMIKGYRGISETNDFGRPFSLAKVEFVN